MNIAELVNQANNLFSQKEYKQAQKLYEQALKLDSENETLNFNLGVAYQAQGKIAKAIKYYKHAANSADAQNNLGLIYKVKGDLKNAEKYYLSALALDQNHRDAYENLEVLRREKATSKVLQAAQKKAEDTAEPLVAIENIPLEIIENIRQSFSYQGLVKALNSNIATKEDIAAEALWEQKTPDLLMDQRVHTVLLSDIENNTIKSQEEDNLPAESDANMLDEEPPARVETSLSPVEFLQKETGYKITNNFKGLDQDGNFLNVTAVEDSGWVKFEAFNRTHKIESFNFPLKKFIAYFKQNQVFAIDSEDFNLVKPDRLKNLTNAERIELIKKIHARTLAKLKILRAQKRNLIERILKTQEAKKLEEILKRIKS